MFTLTLMLALFAADRPLEIIAHRGESADAPENTMAAFKLAWERKLPAIELDVHLTRDGHLTCCHDADSKRTTGVAKAIKECTRQELRELDAGKWKGASFEGEKLPDLAEALATIPEGGRCFIEVKVGPEAIPALVKDVESCGKKMDHLAVISFNAATIAESKKRLPQLKAYYLSGFKKDSKTGQWTPPAERLIAQAQEIKADGLDLSHEGPLDAEFARKIRAAGLELYVWTIDNVDIAKRMQALGVDGITTNRGEWLREQLSK